MLVAKFEYIYRGSSKNTVTLEVVNAEVCIKIKMFHVYITVQTAWKARLLWEGKQYIDISWHLLQSLNWMFIYVL